MTFADSARVKLQLRTFSGPPGPPGESGGTELVEGGEVLGRVRLGKYLMLDGDALTLDIALLRVALGTDAPVTPSNPAVLEVDSDGNAVLSGAALEAGDDGSATMTGATLSVDTEGNATIA